MRYILIFFMMANINAVEIKNFSSKFRQIVINEDNKSIEYRGDIIAQKPSNILYRYTFPSKKSVYILKQNVIIIEPELEQAIIRRIDEEINIFEILKDAKKVKDGVFNSNYKGYKFKIFKENGTIKSIRYKDSLDNQISIEFFDTKTDIKLKKDIFKPDIPSFYDIIKSF